MSRLRAIALSKCIEDDTSHLVPEGNLKLFEFGWPGASPQQVAAVRLRLSLLKKHVDDVSPNADDKALEKFLAANLRCKEWVAPSCHSLLEDLILGEVKKDIYNFWYLNGTDSLCDNLCSLLDEGKHGPGVGLLASGDDFYTKSFSSDFSTTSPLLYNLYSRWCGYRKLWSEAERLRSQHYSVTITDYNKLSFVPKTNEESRVIAVEPLLNMYYQQGLCSVMTDRLRSFSHIDLPNQQAINRELSRRGSTSGGLATIDLSSASDTISLSMVKWLFPRTFSNVLEKLRSPRLRLPNGEFVTLHMISTMGNAFTFPLQTLIFSSVVRSVYRVLDIPCLAPKADLPGVFSWLGNYGVNGDDIVCHSAQYNLVVRILSLLGFTVNESKSFSEGLFRESCGADWYDGCPVRGFYLKDQGSAIAPYVAFNRLSLWAAQTGVALRTTLAYLLRCAKFLPIPWDESESAGFKVSRVSLRSHRDLKGHLHYTRLEPLARHLVFLEDSVRQPSGDKQRLFNGAGVFLALVGGYIRNTKLGVRNNNPKFRTRHCTTPRDWEYTDQSLSCDLSALKRVRSV
jgi:hypothetical protein